MIVGVPKETCPGETRVALAPDSVATLVKKVGLTVQIESNAGLAAGFTDEDYKKRGAEIVESRDAIFEQADIVCQVRALDANPTYGAADLDKIKPEQLLVACSEPLDAGPLMKSAADKGVTHFALELIPRTTRAQSMDVLSSQANLAGYKLVILAAEALPKIFPMFMTAAGTIKPARVLVIGAGVAGLQAIATARRLGAVTSGYDVRSACKEQVESLGAKFVELDMETMDGDGGYAKEQSEDQQRRQQALMMKVVAESDVVVTTAAIPGRKAPVIVTEDMVKKMNPGSVIVDLAAERGGNCECTEAGQTVEKHGVTIIGPQNLPATMAYDASAMFGNNVANFLRNIVTKEGELNLDWSDEITAGTLATRNGQITHARIRSIAGLEEARLEELLGLETEGDKTDDKGGDNGDEAKAKDAKADSDKADDKDETAEADASKVKEESAA